MDLLDFLPLLDSQYSRSPEEAVSNPRLVRDCELTLSLMLPLVKPFYTFNSLTRAVEEFQPQNPPDVTLYSCGPTVYLPQHLGNLRAYVFVDSLRRGRLGVVGFGIEQVGEG